MNEIEFEQYAHRAFAALTETYALRPMPKSSGSFVNRFQARFANHTTIVAVEGINYGFGVDVRLASRDRSYMAHPSYSLGDLLSIRAPEFEYITPAPADTNEIQKRQVDSYVRALAQYADDVLRGDFSVFPQLARAIEERRERYAREAVESGGLADTKKRESAWWKFWQRRGGA